MGGAIDSPNAEQLGYFRRRPRHDTGESAPPEVQAKRPRWKWISIAVFLAVAALIAFYGTALWRSTDRNELAADSVGTWVQSGSAGSVLVITKRPTGGASVGRGDLFFEGAVDHHAVSGVVVVPKFPSMSTMLHLTLLGEQWDLRLPSEHVMTLSNPSGRVITFEGA